MARVTVEDCLKRIPNRFFLVHAAAKRVRQLREGSERLIDAPENEDIVTALREIAAGKVFVTRHYTDYKEPVEGGVEEAAVQPLESKAAVESDAGGGEASGASPALSAEDLNAAPDEAPEEATDEAADESSPDDLPDDAAGDVDESPGNQADDDPNN